MTSPTSDRAALFAGLRNLHKAAKRAQSLAATAGDAAMMEMTKHQALEVQLALSMFDMPVTAQQARTMAAMVDGDHVGQLYDQHVMHTLRLTTLHDRGEISTKAYKQSRATLRANFLKEIENDRA